MRSDAVLVGLIYYSQSHQGHHHKRGGQGATLVDPSHPDSVFLSSLELLFGVDFYFIQPTPTINSDVHSAIP